MPSIPKDNKMVVVVDPKLIMERMLHYRERHHGWHIFRTIYWSIYLLVIATLLIYYYQINFTVPLFFGVAFLLLAIMLILYGLTEALHHKFLKKYG